MVIFQIENEQLKIEKIMKIRNKYIYTLMGLCVAPMAVSAQVTLSDKASQKVDYAHKHGAVLLALGQSDQPVARLGNIPAVKRTGLSAHGAVG